MQNTELLWHGMNSEHNSGQQNLWADRTAIPTASFCASGCPDMNMTAVPSAGSLTYELSVQSESRHGVQEFIDTVLLGNIRNMVYDAGQHYLAFGQIGTAIEFIGACLDDKPWNEEGHSHTRFDKAIERYFKPISPLYAEYNKRDSDYCLYTNLRCGMAHILRPQGLIWFTQRPKRVEAQPLHLRLLPNRQLILVCEDLYDHLSLACKRLKSDLPGLAATKLKKPFFAVRQVLLK